MSWRDVDHEAPKVAVGHRLEVLGDRVNVKTRHEGRRGLDDGPRGLHVRAETATTVLGIHLDRGGQPKTGRPHGSSVGHGGSSVCRSAGTGWPNTRACKRA